MLPLRAYLFIGLNGVRALSIIGLLLVLASNIVTVVHDVQAVNAFMKAGDQSGNVQDSAKNATLVTAQNDDYIMYVVSGLTIASAYPLFQWQHCSQSGRRSLLGRAQSSFDHRPSHRSPVV